MKLKRVKTRVRLPIVLSTFVFGFIFLLNIRTIRAQESIVKVPERSPRCHLVQEVGLSKVTIDYSRPSMRNRLIFGDLVPFDRMWRTGENEATTIEFSDDVLIEGEYLPKGKYALYSIPGEDKWNIIFYKDWDQFGLPKRYLDSEEALSVEVEADELVTTFETLLINIDKIRDSTATLQIIWEDVIVEVNMQFDTRAKVMENIEKALAGPSRADYYLAAKYYYDNHLDMEKALNWVKIANEKGERYWQYLLKGLILKEMGEEEDALFAAQKAKKMANTAGNSKYTRLAQQLIESLEEEPPSSMDKTPPKDEEIKKTPDGSSKYKKRKPSSVEPEEIRMDSKPKVRRRRVIEYRKDK